MDETRKNILIIDDLAMDCELLSDLLSREFHAISVYSGAEAIALLEKRTDFAAILLDLIMPEMDGYEVLKKLSDMGLIHKIPVMVISGEPSLAEVRCLDLGAYDFIRKPFDGRVIKKRVHNAVLRESYRRELEQAVEAQAEKPITAPLTTNEAHFREYCKRHDLSEREGEILRGVLGGRSNVEIAEELYISVNTVKFHVRNLLHKTGTTNRAELMVHYSL